MRPVKCIFLVKYFLRRLFGPLIGLSFATIVFFTSIFGNYIVTLFLPMISCFNQHKKFRELMDRAITFWMVIPLFFMHYIYGVKVRVSGDRIDPNAPAIIIMNHRTRLDWFYFWLALWRINPWLMTTNKIALKQLLRYVPGAGFGMQASQYVFLKRDLETDLKRLSDAVEYYSAMDRPYQLLMFPEGTDKTEHTSRLSREYARKNGLEELKNVLYPRTSGFIKIVNEMKKKNYLTYIYDVTVAYPKDIVQNETDMILKGNVSSTVHYDINRIHIDEIPTQSDTEISQWLLDIWRKKDEKLEKFYAQKFRHKRRLEASGERNLWLRDDFMQKAVKIFGFLFWVSVVSIWIYHFKFILHVQLGFCFLLMNYLYIYGFYGGIDHMIYARWDKWRTRTMETSNCIRSSVTIV